MNKKLFDIFADFRQAAILGNFAVVLVKIIGHFAGFEYVRTMGHLENFIQVKI